MDAALTTQPVAIAAMRYLPDDAATEAAAAQYEHCVWLQSQAERHEFEIAASLEEVDKELAAATPNTFRELRERRTLLLLDRSTLPETIAQARRAVAAAFHTWHAGVRPIIAQGVAQARHALRRTTPELSRAHNRALLVPDGQDDHEARQALRRLNAERAPVQEQLNALLALQQAIFEEHRRLFPPEVVVPPWAVWEPGEPFKTRVTITHE